MALAAVLANSGSGLAHADGCEQDQPISSAQLAKLLAYVRSGMGAAAVFYAPLPYDFGWTDNPRADAPDREVATDDLRHSFAQSDADGGDYVITELSDGGAYLFVTRPDFCLRHALYSPRGRSLQVLDVGAASVRSRYQHALRAWAIDIDRSPPAPVVGGATRAPRHP